MPPPPSQPLPASQPGRLDALEPLWNSLNRKTSPFFLAAPYPPTD